MSIYSAWLYVIKQDNINNLSTFEKMTSLFFKQITEFMFLNPKPGSDFSDQSQINQQYKSTTNPNFSAVK